MPLVVRRHRSSQPARWLHFLVAVFVLAAFFWAIFFIWQRFTAPPSLAKILPAEQTLAFFQLNLAAPDTKKLLVPYAGVPPEQLLELDFPLPADFWSQVSWQAGIALLGHTFDPANSVLVVHARQPKILHALLAGTALPTENLTATGEPQIFTLPQSGTLFFAWRGSTLLLAKTEAAVRQVLAPGPRVTETAEYAAVITRTNPHAAGFGYLAPRFVAQLTAGTAAGVRRALLQPLAGQFAAAGVQLSPSATDWQLQIFTPLTPATTRTAAQKLASPKTAYDLAAQLPKEVDTFFAGHGADQFFTQLAKITPAPTRLLATNLADDLAHQIAGSTATFATALAPVFAQDFAVGITSTGGYFGLARPTNATQTLSQLTTKLAEGDGWLASMQTRELPDGTRTAERRPTTVTKKIETVAGQTVTQLAAGDRQIWLTVANGFLIAATEKVTFENLLVQLSRITTTSASQPVLQLPLRSMQPLLAPFTQLKIQPTWLTGEGAFYQFLLKR